MPVKPLLTCVSPLQLPTLDPEDVKRISALDRGQRLCNKANKEGKVWGWTYEQLGWGRSWASADAGTRLWLGPKAEEIFRGGKDAVTLKR